MAELILTDEEKADGSYMDWDDASLGRCCKRLAAVLGEKRTGNGGPVAISQAAGLILAGQAYDCNATEMTITIEGCTWHEKPVGDWRIRIERLPEKKRKGQSGE